MELPPPPSLIRPIVTAGNVAGCAVPSALLAPAVPRPTTAVDTVATVMTPAASKPVAKTRLAFLLDRPIAPVLSTVSSLGIRGRRRCSRPAAAAPRLRLKRGYHLAPPPAN